jgi:hypothetical protein
VADQNKVLELVLQLKADVAAGVAATKAGLQEIQVQATETARVVNSVGQTTVAVNPANVEAIAQSEARMATMLASQEKSAVNEALINAQMERRVIIETQLEAAEATIAGNPAMAIRLEREADIRTRALAIQRTLNITTEESIALAERMVIAEEASAVATNTMGINMAKAKTEALVLGREMAAGNVRASTMSSLLGSLGTTFTIAGIAAYELYHFIAGQVEETKKLNDEYKKITGEIGKISKEWETAASRAQTFSDTVKLADKVKQDLTRMQADMAAFRARELPLWQSFWDNFVTGRLNFNQDIPSGPAKVGPFEAERQKKALEETNRQLLKAREKIDASVQSVKDWALAEDDLPKGLADYTAKLDEAQSRLEVLNAASKAHPTDPNALQAYIDQLAVVDDLKGKVNQLGDELDKNNRKSKEHSGIQKEITATLRDQANILSQIRANQQSVQQNPFLSADQKQAAMLPLITQEAAALGEQLKRDQAEQSKLTDPSQWNRMQGAIIQAKARLTELGYEAQKSSFLGGVRAELTAWVNSFGSTVHQLSGIITGTLNTAINATSQALTNAIFKTGSWKQAFAQAAQSIVQNIIQILLQWIVSQTIMRVLSAAFKKADVAATSSAASESAAAWAPAATAASIATEGAADETGVGALAIAMAAGQTIVTAFSAGGGAGGAKEGWYVDRGSHSTADDVNINVSRGEGIINARAVAAHGGKSWVDRINSNVTRPGFAGGGFLGSGSPGTPIVQPGAAPDVHLAVFDDPKKLAKWLAGREGQRIIFDTVERRRIDLGI